MLKPNRQHFGHLMRRTNSLKKIPIQGNIEGTRRRGQQRMRWLDSITDYEVKQTPRDSEGQENLCAAVLGITESDRT